jgi:hypothetical protein
MNFEPMNLISAISAFVMTFLFAIFQYFLTILDRLVSYCPLSFRRRLRFFEVEEEWDIPQQLAADSLAGSSLSSKSQPASESEHHVKTKSSDNVSDSATFIELSESK